MTFERNYAIAIAMLSDWLRNCAPIFKPMRSKSNTNRIVYARFPVALRSSYGILIGSSQFVPRVSLLAFFGAEERRKGIRETLGTRLSLEREKEGREEERPCGRGCIALFAPVVIGQSNYFGASFSTLI